jgi:3-phosphoshikimate 1-carboxyvinyltransferase
VQECERVFAMKTELHKCGVKVEEDKDTLIIYPGPVHGGVIDTYEDHRIAMCFSVLGTVVPGIIIRQPSCVKKTFPNFYQKLASPPPDGLGMTLTLPGKNLSLSSDTLIA